MFQNVEGNVAREEDFPQVCVWPGTILPEEQVDDFESWFASEFNTRVKFLECVKTYPDVTPEGNDIPGTGGRSDLLFAVHKEDVHRFATGGRLAIGARWIEDVLSNTNNNWHIYPRRLVGYCTWNEDDLPKLELDS